MKRLRADEALGAGSHERHDLVARAHEQPDELARLVGGDPARHPEQHPRHGSHSAHLKVSGRGDEVHRVDRRRRLVDELTVGAADELDRAAGAEPGHRQRRAVDREERRAEDDEAVAADPAVPRALEQARAVRRDDELEGILTRELQAAGSMAGP